MRLRVSLSVSGICLCLRGLQGRLRATSRAAGSECGPSLSECVGGARTAILRRSHADDRVFGPEREALCFRRKGGAQQASHRSCCLSDLCISLQTTTTGHPQRIATLSARGRVRPAHARPARKHWTSSVRLFLASCFLPGLTGSLSCPLSCPVQLHPAGPRIDLLVLLLDL